MTGHRHWALGGMLWKLRSFTDMSVRPAPFPPAIWRPEPLRQQKTRDGRWWRRLPSCSRATTCHFACGNVAVRKTALAAEVGRESLRAVARLELPEREVVPCVAPTPVELRCGTNQTLSHMFWIRVPGTKCVYAASQDGPTTRRNPPGAGFLHGKLRAFGSSIDGWPVSGHPGRLATRTIVAEAEMLAGPCNRQR